MCVCVCLSDSQVVVDMMDPHKVQNQTKPVTYNVNKQQQRDTGVTMLGFKTGRV